MKSAKIRRFFVAASALLALGAAPAKATTFYWWDDGATTGFSDTNNWTDTNSDADAALTGAGTLGSTPLSFSSGDGLWFMNVDGVTGAAAENDIASLTIDTITFDNSQSFTISGTNAIGVSNIVAANDTPYSGTTPFTAAVTHQINTDILLGVGVSKITTDVDNNITISGAISGAGSSLSISGPATVTLTGANTYDGGTTINGGNLIVNTDSLPGDVVNNATLEFNQTQTTPGTFAGSITGSGSLVKSGAGQVTLSSTSASAYTAGTTVSEGTLIFAENATHAVGVNNDANLTYEKDATFNWNLTGSGTTTISGTANIAEFAGIGTLVLSGPATINVISSGSGEIKLSGTNAMTVNAGTVAFTAGVESNFGGIISGTGSLVVDDLAAGNTLTLSGANTYTGGTTITSGTLVGTTVSLQGDIVNSGTVKFNQTNAGTYSGIISGATGALVKDGSGDVTLSGLNSFGGGTTISGGKLIVNTDSLPGDVVNNATLEFNQTQTTPGTFAGNITGSGSFVKSGSGEVTLSSTSASAYTGTTTVSEGILNFSESAFHSDDVTNNATLNYAKDVTFDSGLYGSGTTAITGNASIWYYNGSGTLDVSGSSSVSFLNGSGEIKLSGTNAMTVYAGFLDIESNSNFNGVISGTGALVLDDDGDGNTLVLSGANTYTGGTTITSGTLEGTTESLQGQIVNNDSLAFNQSTDGTTAANLVISGTGTVEKLGSGNVVLAGTVAHSYTGGTFIYGGTLTGNTYTLQGLIEDNATMTFDQDFDGTYASVISGSGNLVKDGSGKVTLSSTGAASYLGTTTVNAGTLEFSQNVTHSDTVTNNATLNYLGTAYLTELAGTGTTSFSAAATIASITGVGAINMSAGLTLDNSSTTASIYSGAIGGTGTVTKTGSGIQYITGANTYTGATMISDGTLAGTTDSLLSTSSITIGTSGTAPTLRFDQAFDGSYTSALVGTGSLEKYGTGHVTLTSTGAANYLGTTHVDQGELEFTQNIVHGDTVMNLDKLTYDQNATFTGLFTAGRGDYTSPQPANTTVYGNAQVQYSINFYGALNVDGSLNVAQYSTSPLGGLGFLFGSGTTPGSGMINILGTINVNGLTTITNFAEAGGTTNFNNNATITDFYGDMTGGMGFLGGSTPGPFLNGTTTILGTGEIQTFHGAGNRLNLESTSNIHTLTSVIDYTSSPDTTSNISIVNDGTVLRVDNGDYSGTISGAGDLYKRTVGVLTLYGNATYTGETWNDLGSTLNFIQNTVHSDVVNNLGILNYDSDATFTTLTGSGKTTISGSATIFNHASTGGTTIYGNANITTLGGTKTKIYGLSNIGYLDSLLVELVGSSTINVRGGSGTLTLSGNSSNTYNIGTLEGNGTINVINSTSTLAIGEGTYSGVLTGAGSLAKDGTGTLTLTGLNAANYTGTTTVNGGELIFTQTVDHDANVTVNSGATLNYEKSVTINATLDSSGTTNITKNATITTLTGSGVTTVGGSTNIGTVNGSGTLYANGTSPAVFGTIDQSVGGQIITAADAIIITLQGDGLATIGRNALIGTVAGNANANISGYANISTISTSGTVNVSGTNASTVTTLTGSGITSFTGAATITTRDSSATGELHLGSSSSVYSLNGSGLVTIAGTKTLTVRNGSYDGTISGAGNLDKTTGDTLTLTGTGASNYTGATNVTDGILNFSEDASHVGTVTTSGTAALNYAKDATFSTLTGSGHTTVSGDAYATTLSGTGITDIVGLATIATRSGSGELNLSDAALIETLNGSGIVNIATAGKTLEVNDGAYSGSVIGDGNLTKTTGGTLTLSGTGASNYTGTTTVSAGTLAFTADAVHSDTVTNSANLSYSNSATFTTLLTTGTTSVGANVIAENLFSTTASTYIGGNANVAQVVLTSSSTLTVDGTFDTGTGSSTSSKFVKNYGSQATFGDAATINYLVGSGVNTTNDFQSSLDVAFVDNQAGAVLNVTGPATVGVLLNMSGTANFASSYDSTSLVWGGAYGLNNNNFGTINVTGSFTVTGTSSAVTNDGRLTVTGPASITSLTDNGTTNLNGGATIDTREAGSAGTINLGSTSSIYSLNGTGIVTIAGTKTLTVNNGTYDGEISSAGSLIKETAGTLTLNGANASNYTGTTTVAAGTLAFTANATHAANVTNNSILNYAADATFTSELNGSGTTTVTGYADIEKYNGTSAAQLNILGGSLIHTLSGSGSVAIASGKLLTVEDGSNSGSITGAGSLNKTTAGTLTLSGTGASNYTGDTSVAAGTLVFTQAAVHADSVSNQATLNYNSDATFRNGLQSDGTTSIGGNVTANLIYVNGTLNVAGTSTITDLGGTGTANFTRAATIDAVYGPVDVNFSSSSRITALTGSGTIDIASTKTLTVENGTSSASITGDGDLNKTTGGTLTLTGTSSYGDTTITDGYLVVNGSVTSANVSVGNGAYLKGRGTIIGDITVQNGGTLAVGNSPGILNATGDQTLAAGSAFEAEIGGLLAGNAITNHDQFNVTGTVTIAGAPGVLLDLYSAGTFTTLARGNALTVIKASSGISGAFTDMVNNDFAGWALFDNNSSAAHKYGNIVGTGLASTETFADYTTDANRAAIAGSLWTAAVTESTSSAGTNRAGFIDSNTNSGKAALALIKASSGAATDAVLDSFSPEAFIGLSDYVLTTARTVTDSALSQSTMAKNGNWLVGAGFTQAHNDYTGGTSTALNRNLSSDTTYVALSYECDPKWKVGFFYGHNTGKTTSSYSSTSYSGNVIGLSLDGTIEGRTPVMVKAAIAHSDLSFDTNRTAILGESGDEEIVTTSGTSTSANNGLKGLSAQVTASIKLSDKNGLKVSPLLGLVYGRSTSDAFTEVGTGVNLAVNGMTDSSTRAILGVSMGYAATTSTSLALSLGLEKELGSTSRTVDASLDGNSFSVSDAGSNDIVTNVGIGAVVDLGYNATFNLGAEFRAGNSYTGDRRINASFNKRF